MSFENEEFQEVFDIGKCPHCGCFPVFRSKEWKAKGLDGLMHTWYMASVECSTSDCVGSLCYSMHNDKTKAEDISIEKWQNWVDNK